MVANVRQPQKRVPYKGEEDDSSLSPNTDFLDEQQQDEVITQFRQQNEVDNRRTKHVLAAFNLGVTIFFLFATTEATIGFNSSVFLPPTRPPEFALAALISTLVPIFSLVIVYSHQATAGKLPVPAASNEPSTSTSTPQPPTTPGPENPFLRPLFLGTFAASCLPVFIAYTKYTPQPGELYWPNVAAWAIPMVMVLVSTYSVKMMGDVQWEVDKLEAAKYKFKGA
ncbi:hypothetical protein HK102_009802 [Quaeritorhiza haematococci]|nr:hypothetical protein HK102_009802 [Quaeritorhiza haematococci]